MINQELSDKYLWVEKYRPKMIDEIVLPDSYRDIFNKYLNDGKVPHLLMYGPAGSGKTTIAKIFVRYIIKNRDNLMMLNGSSKTGVDNVRDNIEDFLRSPSYDGKQKIVFIDEADFLSQQSQGALRNIMETYSQVGAFILTCNYISKIITPLQSRCQTFEFKTLPKEYIDKYVKNILDKEGIKYGDIINKVITTHYPDIRKIVNTLQSRVNSNKEISSITIESENNPDKLFIGQYMQLIIDLTTKNDYMINKTLNNMLSILKDNELDFNNVYQELFFHDTVPIWTKIIINKYMNDSQNCMLPNMHIMAMVYDIIKNSKSFV